MSWSIIAQGSNGVTTGGPTVTLNTVGADLIVIGNTTFTPGAPPPSPATPTDSQSNTWTNINDIASPALSTVTLWYKQNPTTNSSHTFNGEVSFGSFFVLAVKGSLTAGSLDQSNTDQQEGDGSSTFTCSTGSITPTVNGSLIVAFYGEDAPPDASTPTINDGFTVQQFVVTLNSGQFGLTMGTLVQATAAAIDPTLTRPTAIGSGKWVNAVIANFKPALPVVFRRALSPVGTRTGSRQVHNRWRRSDRGGLLLRDTSLILPKAA